MKLSILCAHLATSLAFSAAAFASDLPEGTVEGRSELFHNGQALELTAPEGEVDDDSWTNYLYDECGPGRDASASALRICQDRTMSFVQPKSSGIGGWEGKCGQTAASNLIYSYCAKVMDPGGPIDDIFKDVTPGIRPDTLRKGMDEIFWRNGRACGNEGSWKWYYNKNAEAFIVAIKKLVETPRRSGPALERVLENGSVIERAPLAILIRNPGSHTLHWITLVDVAGSGDACKAIVNHWDNQYKVPCSTLAKWAKGVNRSYPLLFRPYNIVVLRELE